MDTENKSIDSLVNTIERLTKTIESQGEIINNLRNRLESIQNEYAPSIITVKVLIDKLENSTTRTGKPKFESLKKHILPYLTGNQYDIYDFNDELPVFKKKPTTDTIIDKDVIDDMIMVIKSKRKINESSQKLYLSGLKSIFCKNTELKEYINKHISNISIKSPSNISLTEDELNLFWEVETYSKLENIIKKLFLIQCYTSMRYSDIFRLKDSMMENNVISYISKKTGKNVEVPVPEKIVDMIKEVRIYDRFDIESTFKTTMNEILPILGCRAGIDNQVYIRRANKLIRGPKYTFMKTHTGRRTAITRWANMGIPEAELKTMAGHSDIRTTNKYITASVSNSTKTKLMQL